MVGAFARLPAKELIPTKTNEAMVPITAAKVACQKEMPKPKKNEPYESASKEMFPAAHGQKSDLTEPPRSCSAITLMPFNSRCLDIGRRVEQARWLTTLKPCLPRMVIAKLVLQH